MQLKRVTDFHEGIEGPGANYELSKGVPVGVFGSTSITDSRTGIYNLTYDAAF